MTRDLCVMFCYLILQLKLCCPGLSSLGLLASLMRPFSGPPYRRFFLKRAPFAVQGGGELKLEHVRPAYQVRGMRRGRSGAGQCHAC
jgi:hypothetical protein